MFGATLIDGNIQVIDGEIGVPVRLNWYRALPLSCIDFTLRIDDEVIPRADIDVEIAGRRLGLDELEWLYDEQWFTTDTGMIWIRRSSTSGTHEIEVDMRSRLPYVITVWETPERRGEVAEEHDACRRTIDFDRIAS